MNMSSPARSSASATSAGAGGNGTAAFPDESSSSSSFLHIPTDLISAQDRKDEALAVLKEELMAALDKEVKSLDEDSWMFAGPRSQMHLISRPGGFPLKPPKVARSETGILNGNKTQ